MTSKMDAFDASASLLGYLYQLRYALLVALRGSQEVDDPDDAYVSIEKIDDVALEEKDSVVAAFQTKLHGDGGGLSNRSPDLWKTIRIWASAIREGVVDLNRTSFTLITTQECSSGSIAFLLSERDQDRDEAKALELLEEISSTVPSKQNAAGFEEFNLLNSEQKKMLLARMAVVSGYGDAEVVRREIEKKLVFAVDRAYLAAFTDRVEAYWNGCVIASLKKGGLKSINLGELTSKVADMSQQFSPVSLPVDFAFAEPDGITPDDLRMFIKQLSLIGANRASLAAAVKDYFRAVSQRDRWARDGLLRFGELRDYDARLKEEWERLKAHLEWGADLSSDHKKSEFGRRLYFECQSEKLPVIRPAFREPYLMRGSIHQLADSLVVGWHPEYESLLQESANEGAA